ncbi:MAG: stage V sporulation protein AA [Clostridiales bacterium]|nr:stage V sporulation protein AA [Clostridiales bacterium]
MVYLNLREMSEVCDRTVFLKDVADVYCKNQAVQNRCRALKILNVPQGGECNIILSAAEVIRGLEALDPSVEVSNIGKSEFVVAYRPPQPPRLWWQWLKTIFVCIVCFCGAAFAIMTFNNDVNVNDVFREVYLLITGRESDGFTILELSYSIGLAVGILLFFNHFAGWKLNTDPTPLEVEMRLYEENIAKTLIQDSERKEREVDVR